MRHPRLSLGTAGVASVVDMNIDMKPTRKTSVQKPFAPRDLVSRVTAAIRRRAES